MTSGGSRPGSGRKPMPGYRRKTYAFSPEQLVRIEKWRKIHKMATSAEAIRSMVDAAWVHRWPPGCVGDFF